MVQNDYELAKTLSSWKKKVYRSWESIEILSAKTPDIQQESIIVGQEYRCEVIVDLNELSPDDIGVEFLVVEMYNEQAHITLHEQKEFEIAKVDGQIAVYQVQLTPKFTGAYDFGIRIFPKNPNLAHRQDFSLVKWL
jgi:phosphorylase/glycogen(starch) synthase